MAPIRSIEGSVELPGSKSLSNRALLLAALAEGDCKLKNLLRSEDIEYMFGALAVLGVQVRAEPGATEVGVQGCGGHFPAAGTDGGDGATELFLGNAGTAMRPLTAAVAAAAQGTFVLDGIPRMRERPIQDLVDALKALGVDAECTLGTGCPPVRVVARGLPGGTVDVAGGVSSQFLSALLMAAPLANDDLEIRVTGGLVSKPYVELTIGLMRKFGAVVETEGAGLERIKVPGGQTYASPEEVFVEGDASSASYFMAGAAITGGTVKVVGCGSESVQGDVRLAEVLEKMGARVEWGPNSITVTGGEPQGPHGRRLRGITEDCNDIPDAAMTAAVAALFAEGPTRIENVYNWRLKETERMVAICTELRKLGAEVEEGHDFCVIHPPERLVSAEIETYDDHRMAMAFALAACQTDATVTILDPGCTRKTFPDYFDVLKSVSINY